MRSRIAPAIGRPWLLWILLLAAGQAADLMTTKVDIARGALEGNAMVANLLREGGFGLVLALKLAMVLAMALIVLLVQRFAEQHPGGRSWVVSGVVWRGLQVCVVVLTLTALHNVLVLAELQGWHTPDLLTMLARFSG